MWLRISCFVGCLYLFPLLSIFSHPFFPAFPSTAKTKNLKCFLYSGLHPRRLFLCIKLIIKSFWIFSGWHTGWLVHWNVFPQPSFVVLYCCASFFMLVWIKLYLPSAVSGSQMIWNLWILLNLSSLLLFSSIYKVYLFPSKGFPYLYHLYTPVTKILRHQTISSKCKASAKLQQNSKIIFIILPLFLVLYLFTGCWHKVLQWHFDCLIY